VGVNAERRIGQSAGRQCGHRKLLGWRTGEKRATLGTQSRCSAQVPIALMGAQKWRHKVQMFLGFIHAMETHSWGSMQDARATA
jgi:hypothetical protein